MKFSPLDIYNKEFSKATFGGYKVEEVEDFLEEVGRSFENLLKQLNNIKDENEKLKEQLQNYEKIEDKLEQTLLTVQKTAKEQSRQAKSEADMIIDKANIKAENIINDAKKRVTEEKQALKNLQETRKLFKIRFKSLLESHLQMLEESQDFEDIEEIISKNIENLDQKNES